MESVTQRESWFVLEDGMRLFEKTWEPRIPANARLVFLHGFSDRSEIHYSLFPILASPPYNCSVHAIDQRGWGKSVHHPSQRGLTGPTRQVLFDVDAYITHVANITSRNDRMQDGPADPSDESSRGGISSSNSPPLFLMGHSMGGQIALHYLLSRHMLKRRRQNRNDLAGVILEAPYISLHPRSQPSSLLVLAGRVAAMISPQSQMKQHLDSRFITRDETVNREWENDDLCHGYGTLEGLRDMLKRGADLVSLTEVLSRQPDRQKKSQTQAEAKTDTIDASRIQASTNEEGKADVTTATARKLGFDLSSLSIVPMLWTHGTDDRITDFKSSKRLFDALCRHQQRRSRDHNDSRQKISVVDDVDDVDVDLVNLTEFRGYDGAYHKIHAEPDGVGVMFAQDVGDWMLKVIRGRRAGDGRDDDEDVNVDANVNVDDDGVDGCNNTKEAQALEAGHRRKELKAKL